jgi:hypothetical protein
MISGILELDMKRKSAAAPQIVAAPQRRAA